MLVKITKLLQWVQTEYKKQITCEEVRDPKPIKTNHFPQQKNWHQSKGTQQNLKYIIMILITQKSEETYLVTYRDRCKPKRIGHFPGKSKPICFAPDLPAQTGRYFMFFQASRCADLIYFNVADSWSASDNSCIQYVVHLAQTTTATVAVRPCKSFTTRDVSGAIPRRTDCTSKTEIDTNKVIIINNYSS